MFRITEDPSSGSLVKYLAKITRMVISGPLTWTWSVLWRHTVTRCVCSSLYRKALHVNGHDRIILVILAKYCTRLPDDGSSVIRNKLGYFKIFYNFNCILVLYNCVLVPQ